MYRAACLVTGFLVSLLPASARAQVPAPEVVPESDAAPAGAEPAAERGADPAAVAEGGPPEPAAEPGAEPESPRRPWPQIPAGATLERVGPERLALGVAMTNSFYRRDHRDYGLRFELYGQYLYEPGPITAGVFIAVPYTLAGADGSVTGLPGSLDVRAVFVLFGARVPLIAQAGVALGLDHYDDIGRAYRLALAAGRGRTTDLAAQLPSSTWFRAALSLPYREGRFVSRLDFGTDGRLAKSDNYTVDGEDFGARNFLRANVAAGVDAGPVAVMAEAVFVWEYHELGLISPTMALTATSRRGMFEPFASVVVPVFGSVARDIPAMVMAGVRVVPPLGEARAPE